MKFSNWEERGVSEVTGWYTTILEVVQRFYHGGRSNK